MLKLINWRNIKREITIFFMVLGMVTVFSSLSFLFYNTIKDEHTQNTRQYSSLKTKYQDAIQRKEILKTLTPRFKQLVRSGVIGDENRLQWIETIQANTNKIMLPEIAYKVLRQTKTYIADPEIDRSQISLFRSLMNLNFRLLHEGELFYTLNNLDVQAKGLYHIDQCDIKQNTAATLSVEDPSISGSCRLSWYTMKKVAEDSYDESEY